MAQATFVQDGDSIDYTPSVAKAAGDVVVQGTFVGITRTPLEANRLGSLAARGIFDVAKDASDVAAGASLYWDADGNPVGGTAGTGAATTTASGNTFMGFALAAAGTTVGIVRLFLCSMDSGVAEKFGLADLSDVGPLLYTAGRILVADGDSFEDVAVSGDATLAANGALTIANGAVSAGKIAADAVTTAKILNSNVTAAKLADAVADQLANLTVTASIEVAHARTITVQAKDAQGNNLAARVLVDLLVNATSQDTAPTATGTDTFGAPSAGIIVQTVTAKAHYRVQTDATGKYVFDLTHNDAGTSRFIQAACQGLVATSGEIAFDAV